MSWPSWLTCSGRFTHTVVTRRLQAEHRTGSVRRPKTGVLPTVVRNQRVVVRAMVGQQRSPSIRSQHSVLIEWLKCNGTPFSTSNVSLKTFLHLRLLE